jgi:hypothetical protein
MPTPAQDFQTASHLSNEDVALYVDALKLQRTRDLPDEVRDHVANCQDCRIEITGLFSILAEENYATMGPHPYFGKTGESKGKKTRWIYQVAALVAGGVGISILAYFIYSGRWDSTPGATHVSSRETRSGEAVTAESSTMKRPEASGEGTYADNYVELPELESLVAAETRSAGIDVVSPSIGVVVHKPIVFEWKTDSDAPLMLSIMTNKDSLVHRSRIATLPYVLTSGLKRGLYYWKLENGEEVVFVGKFLVR